MTDTPMARRDGAAPLTGGTTAATESTTSSRRCKDVVDPELGINVVDLGLVYGVAVDETTSPRST